MLCRMRNYYGRVLSPYMGHISHISRDHRDNRCTVSRKSPQMHALSRLERRASWPQGQRSNLASNDFSLILIKLDEDPVELKTSPYFALKKSIIYNRTTIINDISYDVRYRSTCKNILSWRDKVFRFKGCQCYWAFSIMHFSAWEFTSTQYFLYTTTPCEWGWAQMMQRCWLIWVDGFP